MDPLRIICVDNKAELATRLRRIFSDREAEVVPEASIDRVLECFERQVFDVLLITGAAVKAGEIDGIELLDVLSTKSPATQILFLVHPREIRLAMSALRAGSYQYAKRPVSDDELRLLVETALAKRPSYGQNLLLKAPEAKVSFGKMIGRSDAMQKVFRQIRQAAAADIAVLLSGETGTGKDLAAQAIHRQSDRKDAPYLPVHLGALPRELVASELFGHEAGAFTGALGQRVGRFEQAAGGTVFLDELSTIAEQVQISLLRLLEQKQFHRLGGRKTVTANVRLIAATNQDLSEAVREGTFRDDLFFRLDVFHIILPPLRERQRDLPLLIDEFVKRYNREFEKDVLGISPDCIGLLEDYDWPGNVRELKNVIQRAVLVCEGEVLLPQHLPPRLRPDRPARPQVTFTVGTPLLEVEREMVVRALRVAGNNRTKAADLLGITRRALYNKLRKHHLS